MWHEVPGIPRPLVKGKIKYVVVRLYVRLTLYEQAYYPLGIISFTSLAMGMTIRRGHDRKIQRADVAARPFFSKYEWSSDYEHFLSR